MQAESLILKIEDERRLPGLSSRLSRQTLNGSCRPPPTFVRQNRTAAGSLLLPFKWRTRSTGHGRPETAGSLACSPQTGRSDPDLNVSEVASNSHNGVPALGHEQSLAQTT